MDVSVTNEKEIYLTNEEEVNLICHSMGCNFGLILAKERSAKINSMVLLSPELQSPSKTETAVSKIRAAHMPEYDNYNISKPEKIKFLQKLSLYNLFEQTKKIANKNRENLTIRSLIIYPYADIYTSQTGAIKLADDLKCHYLEMYTKHHNILLSSSGNDTARIISKFLKY